jgi:DNA-binding response OmpR family regulator
MVATARAYALEKLREHGELEAVNRDHAERRSELSKEVRSAMTNPTLVKETISFGPFQLIASERRLTKDGVRIGLGARAFDILVALISRPNEVISKGDLMSRVCWH